VYSADPKSEIANYPNSRGVASYPKNDLTIAKNSEPYILAMGGKPSYKGQNHGYKNNLHGSSFVFAIRCRANLVNHRLLRPKRGVTKLNRDQRKAKSLENPVGF